MEPIPAAKAAEGEPNAPVVYLEYTTLTAISEITPRADSISMVP